MTHTPAKRALELHRRLLAGDPTASAKLVETMLGPLKAHLRKHHSSAFDTESRDDVAVDAVLAYLQAPEKFDPSKAGLFRYLTLIAENDLKDAIRRRARRPHKFELLVGNGGPLTNTMMEEAEVRADAAAILQRFQHEICSDPGDHAVLTLVLQGETASEEFARALGLDNPDGEEAGKKVTQVKDKIMKRLRRLKEKLDHERR